MLIGSFPARWRKLKSTFAGSILNRERCNQLIASISQQKGKYPISSVGGMNMSDHTKNSADKLQLRLLAVTNDPTYQGNRKEHRKGCNALLKIEVDPQTEIESIDNHTVH